ncbi:MAG: transcription termination/antitermination protein NusA [Chloroflexi bacterium]|nr:transcription termination/antitermination protein NusA [Chloroflexota bacterium]HCU73427.1 transcription termination/antitermination protein NusA [Chloroflexota bacterium]|tara:strand:- start:14111 stop:15364 length:1254 start_codon:yes stop_codon:yes gene_type:complete
MRSDFILALRQLADEKGIQIDAVMDALRTAVASAFEDFNTEYEDIDVEIDPETGDSTVYANKTVVADVSDEIREISVSDAQTYDEDVKIGEIFQIDITPPNFGRIATQKARQAMQQALRDAERQEIYSQFIEHEGALLVGRVTRVERHGVFVDLGRGEAIMLPGDQVPGEFYRAGQRMRVLLIEVAEAGRGSQLRVSRSHSDFVRCLFEREVPEIQSGIVGIEAIARDPGIRTKIAVRSSQEGLDPVGSAVGMRGSRIQNVLRELGEEKVEIILFDEEARVYVGNALSPARVQNVHIDLEQRVADVFVPTDMVSLAIGKEGQNSRLAARLTGFKINIRDAAEPLEARDVAAPEDVSLADVSEGAEEVGDVDKSDSDQSSFSADETIQTDSGTDGTNEKTVSVETGENTTRKPAGSED